MKRHSSQLGIGLLAAITLLAGCNKKKQPTVPPQAQAPPISTPQPATQTPGQQIPVNQPPTTAPATPPPATSTAAKPKAKTKPKTNHAKKNVPAVNTPATGKEASATPASPSASPPGPAPATTANIPNKTVVHDGGTPDASPGEILPGMDQNEAARQRNATEQLLQSTDDTLKGISRPLNDDERAMIEQIRNYMAQSRAAATDGDLLRANNLAVKAHLLSDALIKR
ncbi:MAG TPA: hypothetical protein VFA71_04835 [Terriglobales bacterium]|nr:hypothetical protein [Terriglobales bacterium]